MNTTLYLPVAENINAAENATQGSPNTYRNDFGETEFNTKPLSIGIGCLGVVANGFVLVVMALSPKLRVTNTHYFIVNQTTLDLLSSICLIISRVYDKPYTTLFSLADTLFCKLIVSGYISWASLVSSSYNLVAVSIERWLAIVYPIWHRKHYTNVILGISLSAAWLIGFVAESSNVWTTRTVNGQCRVFEFWPSPDTQAAVGVFTIVYQFFIPIFIHSVCYGRMAYVFTSRKKATTPAPAHVAHQVQLQTQRNNKRTRNILKTFGIVTFCFFLCWVSNEMLWLGVNIGYIDFMFTKSAFYSFSILAVFVNCCLNPFIYILKYDDFRDAVLHIVRHRGQVAPYSLSQPESHLSVLN